MGKPRVMLNRIIDLKQQSSSSRHAINTDIPDLLSPPNPIVHCFRQIFRSTSRIDTELLYIASSCRPAFVRWCEGIHGSASLMISALLLQQYPACLVRQTLIVFVMGYKWPYSCCFVSCCLHDLFNIARSILV